MATELHGWLDVVGHHVFLDRAGGVPSQRANSGSSGCINGRRWAVAMVCVLMMAYLNSTWCCGEVAGPQSRGTRLLLFQAEPRATHPLPDGVRHIDLTGDGVATRNRLTGALRRLGVAGGPGWLDARREVKNVGRVQH